MDTTQNILRSVGGIVVAGALSLRNASAVTVIQDAVQNPNAAATATVAFLFGEQTSIAARGEPKTEIAESEIGADRELEKTFNERADRWEMESAVYSSPGYAFLHKDFIFILSRIGERAIPMILERLKTSQVDWLWALENLTDDNPAAGIDDFESAVKAWLEWGKTKH